MREEVDRQNNDMPTEESENYCYRLVGKRGQRTIAKVKHKKNQDTNRKRQLSPETQAAAQHPEKAARV